MRVASPKVIFVVTAFLCLLPVAGTSASGGAGADETCSEVEEWLKASDLTESSRQIILGILKDERITSVALVLDDFEIVKALDAYKKLSLGAAKTFEDHVESTRNLNNRDANGGTALIRAAISGDEDAVTVLLKKGAKVDLQNKYEATALHLAAWKGFAGIVWALLEKGADPGVQNKEGRTALMLAAQHGHTDVVRALLKKGADPNTPNKDGRTAIMYAAQDGHADVVRALLKKGASVDLQNKHGESALILAAGHNHAEAVRALLEKGATPELADQYGLTARWYAEGLTIGGIFPPWNPETVAVLEEYRDRKAMSFEARGYDDDDDDDDDDSDGRARGRRARSRDAGADDDDDE